MQKIRMASIYGALAVILGAFGAHGLKEQITSHQLEIFQTGVQYQMIHSLALLAIGILIMGFEAGDSDTTALKHLNLAAKFFGLGITFFSGSLYLLATQELLNISEYSHILGPITPIGGLFFIIGWVFLFIFSVARS